ncbi:ImmA/IrrE family metallo-endopeptidase [Cupriavidus sp. M-11]|uniref:ImmA/IrrE family metallo-endopeptidase n=1 Tax=Cupriavidus sp. M-11 TaxID=3233038 RepID=UPI003F8F490B
MAFVASGVPARSPDLVAAGNTPGRHALLAANDNAGPGSAPCYPIIEALMAALQPADAPLDCIRLALGAGRALHRADQVCSVQPSRLQSFDGALYRTGARAWTILYSDRLAAPDARFMIAYLLGRHLLGGTDLDFVECANEALMAMPDDESAGGQAYAFAGRLLMPLDVCRRTLPGAVDLDALAALAGRLGLPLTHVARRWLSYTAQKAVLTLEHQGRRLGSWASETAFGLCAERLGGTRMVLADGIGIGLSIWPRHAAVRGQSRRPAAFPR